MKNILKNERSKDTETNLSEVAEYDRNGGRLSASTPSKLQYNYTNYIWTLSDDHIFTTPTQITMNFI